MSWQEWHQKTSYGRANCIAAMWVHNCKGCVNSETTTVLCPGCKAPFANKGPKWYLNLAKKCKYGNTRDNAWSKLEQNIKTLINLGESSEAVIKRILSLACIEISDKQKTAAAAAVSGSLPMPRNNRKGTPRNSRDLKAANSLADLGRASFAEEQPAMAIDIREPTSLIEQTVSALQRSVSALNDLREQQRSVAALHDLRKQQRSVAALNDLREPKSPIEGSVSLLNLRQPKRLLEEIGQASPPKKRVRVKGEKVKTITSATDTKTTVPELTKFLHPNPYCHQDVADSGRWNHYVISTGIESKRL